MRNLLCILLFMGSLLLPDEIYGQCQDPGLPEGCTYDVGYNFLEHNPNNDTYSWSFQGSIEMDDEPACQLMTGEKDYCFRAILFRPVGTSNWECRLDYVSDDENDFLYTVSGLAPCTLYEFKITCQGCHSLEEFPGYCYDFFDSEMAAGNLSQSFTKSTGLPNASLQPIENIQVDASSSTEIEVSWDEYPDALGYKLFLTTVAPSSCSISTFATSTSKSFDIGAIGSCSACQEYTLNIQPIFLCAGNTRSGIITPYTFPIGECTVMITNISGTNTTAEVEWESVYGNALEYVVQWRAAGGAMVSTLVDQSPYTIINLNPHTDYEIIVRPVCAGGGCIVRDAEWFRTDCDTYEPNDTEAEAMLIPFDEVVESKLSESDVDYFKFIPDCEFVIVESAIGYFDEIIELQAFLEPQVIIYPDVGFDYVFYYKVIPGEEYLLKMESPIEGCYQFKIVPYDFCETCPSDILGPEEVVLSGYSLSEDYYFYQEEDVVDWSISGPAEFIDDGQFRKKVQFNNTGTVVLSTTVTFCDGQTRTTELAIEVTGFGPDDCGEIQNLIVTLPQSSGGIYSCYRNIIAMGDVSPGASYHWSLTYSFPDGNTWNQTVTTPNNALTVFDYGYDNQCYNLAISVQANCNPALSPIYSDNFIFCWYNQLCDNERSSDGKAGNIESKQLSLYPNPVSNVLQVEFGTSRVRSLQIFDAQGRRMEAHQIDSGFNSWQLDVSQYPAGVYLLEIADKAGLKSIEKFMVVPQ